MKATIEGTPDQVRDGAERLAQALGARAKRGKSNRALANKKIAAEHKLLVAAFKAVRNKPEFSEVVQRLLGGISNLSKRTTDLLDEAKAILDIHEDRS